MVFARHVRHDRPKAEPEANATLAGRSPPPSRYRITWTYCLFRHPVRQFFQPRDADLLFDSFHNLVVQRERKKRSILLSLYVLLFARRAFFHFDTNIHGRTHFPLPRRVRGHKRAGFSQTPIVCLICLTRCIVHTSMVTLHSCLIVFTNYF